MWLCLVIERASRRIVAWVLSSLGTAMLARLWQALPRRSLRHMRYFTDFWRVYPQVLSFAAYCVPKAGMRVV